MRGIWKLNITICLTALLFAMTGNSDAGNVEVKLPTNSAFQVISGVQPLLHVGSNGKIGIGTTNPENALTIQGNDTAIQIGDQNGTISNVNTGIQFMDTGNKNVGLRFDGTKLIYESASATGQPSTWYGGVSADFVVRNGNVGIGTTSPNVKLSLGLDITQKKLAVYDDPASFYGFGLRTGYLDFLTNNTVSMTISGNGNVGIGTTNPTYKLHVNGTAAGTSWTNLSSREFKEDINVVGESEHPMMLAKLMNMDLNRYRYKKEYGGDDDTTKLGFIAEEMPKEVLSKDGKGVDVYELLAFTIGAMKAQQKEIESQRQYNKALEDRLAALEKLLEGK